jgi:ligand-binding sensor domain-containing protein
MWIAAGSSILGVNLSTGQPEISRDIRMKATRVCASGSGSSVLVGGPGGALRLHCSTGQISRLFDRPASAVFEDIQGNIWIGMERGLLRLSSEDSIVRTTGFRHEQSDPSSLSDDVITTIMQDAEGNMWIGTFAGLHYLDYFSPNFLPCGRAFRYDPRRLHSLLQ